MRLLVFLLLSTTYLNAQQLQPGPEYDSVDFRRIRVNNLYLGAKPAEVERKFGAPKKVVTTEAAKGSDLYSDYVYGKSTLRISPAGVFNGFKISDPDWVVGVGRHVMKCGASLKEFAIFFPASFREYTKDTGGKFRLKMKTGHTFILFKTKDGIVTGIETWDEPQTP